MGCPAVALTDHGVVHGLVSFYRAARTAGIKPILGCELYMTPHSRLERQSGIKGELYHLVVLAMDEIGYYTLINLCSLGHTEGIYYKPRVD